MYILSKTEDNFDFIDLFKFKNITLLSKKIK